MLKLQIDKMERVLQVGCYKELIDLNHVTYQVAT